MKNGNDSRSMVERVAEAIWMANRPPGAPRYEDLDFQDQDIVEIIARRCIEAMKDPTEDMIPPADSVLVGYGAVWNAMIDRALEED